MAGTADGGRGRDDVMDGLRVGSVEDGGGRRSIAAVLRCLLLFLMASRGQEGTRTETVGGSRAKPRIDSEESASERPHGPPRVRPRTTKGPSNDDSSSNGQQRTHPAHPCTRRQVPWCVFVHHLLVGRIADCRRACPPPSPSLHLVCRTSTLPATVSPALERE